MKFKKAIKEKQEIALDPTQNGGGKGVLKGNKDHNDEFVKIGKEAKGQSVREGLAIGQGATAMADVVGTNTPSSVDWVNSPASNAKKAHIGMAFNKNAPGQKPAHIKNKRKKKVKK